MKTEYISTIITLLAATCPLATFAEVLPDTAKVNMAFRTVEAMDLPAGVDEIDVEKLFDKDRMTYSLADMASLVAGYNGQLWNMGDPLVLVDGVPRESGTVRPSEISKITFMKSAAAVALYGSRASHGVILITTKRGNNDGLQVSVHGGATLNVPKSYPKYLGSAEYMTLYNEALRNDGLSPAFSQSDIYNYSTGNNIYRYPDTNFFSSDYLKKNYMSYDATAEFRGGGQFAKFYANVSFNHNDDLTNFGEGKKNKDNRLSVRGNIDLRINDWLSGYVNTAASFSDVRRDNANYWVESATLRPTNPGASPLVPLIPISMIDPSCKNAMTYVNNSNYIVDGKYILGGTQNNMTNPFAAMYAAGHNTATSRFFQFNIGIDMDLARVLKGLSFHTQFAVDYATSYVTSINNEYATYQATWDDALGYPAIVDLTKFGQDKKTATQNVSESKEAQTMLWNAHFDYKNTFNSVHNVSAMALVNGWQQSTAGEYHRTSNVNLGINLNYNYDNRYFAEFTGVGVHSSKLAPGHRNGFSPVGTLAWMISNENWLKDSSWVNQLRLTTSLGAVKEDLDIQSYYMYQGIFTDQATWWGWSETNDAIHTTDATRGENLDLKFVTRKEFTVGLDAVLLDNLVNFSANFFNINLNDQLTIPASLYPNYFQTWWPVSDLRPYINYNNQRRTGFDFSLNLKKEFGDFNVGVGFNGMYYTSKNTRISEIAEYDWLKTEGAPIDALRGYQCLGFFKDEEDVASSAKINNNTRPGDLKYKDQNNDGIIDERDKVQLGKWNAPFCYGINLTLGWKGFTLFAAGSGSTGGMGIKGSNDDSDAKGKYMWVYGNRKYSEVVRGRWTPETAETATYPRLTTQGGELNFVDSDFWTYSTSAFYLNKIQLTYEFPSKMFADKFVKGLQIFVDANDLATISKERKYLEMNVGGVPQCRSYNLGVRIDF